VRLARIAGIDVYVHATFFMVIAWIALVYLAAERHGCGGR
jgi:hypothetical protein